MIAFFKRAGGCNFAFDPAADARDVTPIWINNDNKTVRLTAVSDDAEDGALFELWQLPGRKCLTHDGACLCASIKTVRDAFQLRLSNDLASGKRFGFVLPANGRMAESLQAVGTLSALFHRTKDKESSAVFDRPSRSKLNHFRTLQALDGVSVGASHRDIASALVGEETVATQWSSDSTLRAHVRSLIQRGRQLLNGGYRALVEGRHQHEQGGIE